MIPAVLSSGIEMRSYRLGDAERLFAAVDGDRDQLRQFLPWIDATKGVKDSAAFIRFAVEMFETGHGLHCGLFDDDHQIGGVGAKMTPVERSAEVGYWLVSSSRGRGIMTEAVAEVLEELFGRRRVHRVMLRAATGNAPSRSLAERLGFTHEGTQRDAGWVGSVVYDYEMYSMLAPEWARQG